MTETTKTLRQQVDELNPLLFDPTKSAMEKRQICDRISELNTRILLGQTY